MGPRLGSITGTLAALSILPSSASALPFGVQIYSCTTPGVIAPAFDDGPGVYSADILDRMEVAGFKATWFINGENRGSIYDHNATLRRMVDLGHQIGSHTWSHANLSSLTPTAIRSEMTLLEDAMLDILGFFPYYMRPPLLSVNSQALRVLQELEYHVIIGDLNTKDWKYQTKETVGEAKRLFVEGLERGESIVEAHDQELWTQGELIDYMIAVVRERGIKSKLATPAPCIEKRTLTDE
ncbi:hypothetical protein J4E85_003662 [Alternaria conjuncta]|uniref:uncharacterized protein n=1 Tax=Alternaria conjuncta TaxID=181017 RepID=UPI00222073EC|nr:uncharacterized protein J4E85_003662 [Alternaria conjuncta]KAI4933257.1 hypothetical protein J4E85_003662 [Alternaria conjuncta]